MRGYSKITLVGNLGTDPETRILPSGDTVADLRLAVNTRKGAGDAAEETVNWFSVSTFGKMAENAAEYLRKGDPVMVHGRFFAREYTGKEGDLRISLDVRADDVIYLSNPAGEDAAEQAPAKAKRPLASGPNASRARR